MAPFSRAGRSFGGAHARTRTGRWYQVHPRTTPVASAAGASRSVSGYPVAVSHVLRFGFLLLAAIVATACGSAAASFDPTSACTTDGQQPGAYPALEARIPTTYQGTGPEKLDSGRSCTAANLGSLAAAGFTEIRFAGGTWTFGAERAAVLAVFTAKGLTAEKMADFYTQSARAASRTTVTGESALTLAGRPGRRLDTTTGSRLQIVVVWPAADPDYVNVVISNDLPDARIDDAVAAYGGR